MTAEQKEKTISGNTENGDRPFGIPWRIAAWAVAVLFLMANFVGNQLSAEVNWTVSDFVFAGVLLFGSLGVYEVVVRTTRDLVYRAAVGVALAAAVLLVWISGAVGIIGTESNPATLLYGGVLAVGIIGALIGRFRPQGMARALIATALAQALVTVIALIVGRVPAYNSVNDVYEIFRLIGINGFIVTLWVGSAWLFGRVAHGEAERGAP